MAAIREHPFSDPEIIVLVGRGHAAAAFALDRNKQEHYELYESLATALQQAQAERTALRGGVADATRPEQEKADDESPEEPDSPKRKRVRRQ